MVKQIFLALLAAILYGNTAAAEFATLGAVPGTEGAWVLEADPETAVCLASAEYIDTKNRLGFMSDGEQWGLLLANDGWKLPVGVRYEITLLTERHRWGLELSVISAELMVSSGTLNTEFIQDLSRTEGFELFRSDMSLIGTFSMEGSSKAITAAAQCAQRLTSARRSNRINPFETLKDNPFGGAEKRI